MELTCEVQAGVGQPMPAATDKPVDAKSYRHKQFLLTLNFKKMKKTKMSLANIQGKLSRTEMKKIMAGSGVGCYKCCYPGGGACSDCVWSYSSAPCEYGSVLTSCSGCLS